MNIGDIVVQRQVACLQAHEAMKDMPLGYVPQFEIAWVDCDLMPGAMDYGYRNSDGWAYFLHAGSMYRHRICDAEYLMALMAEGKLG